MGQLVFQATLGGTTALVGPNTAATNSLTIPNASGALAWSTSALTSTRIPYAGTAGVLQDSANFVFDGTNVGIGTSSPTTYGGLLNVVSTIAGSAKVNISDYSAGASPAPLLQFGLSSSNGFVTTDGARVWATSPSATTAALNFAAYNGSAPSTAQMTLTGGSVGIGTSSPAYKLDVVTSVNNGLSVTDGTYRGIFLPSSIGGVATGTTTSHPFIFITSNSERMRVAANGSVGINTSSSIYNTFHVNGGVSIQSGPVYATAGEGLEMWYNPSISTGVLISYDRTNNIYKKLQIDSSELTLNYAGNNVIIGNTAAAGRLTLKQGGGNGSGSSLAIQRADNTNTWEIINANDDSLYLLWNASNRGVFNTTTGIYSALSDENKKKDFAESTLGLEAVKQLKPTLFRMENEDESVPLSLGFIAQEVQSVIPQAYVEQDSPTGEKFIGLQDRPFIAVLTKAIQELNDKIISLEEQILNLGVK